MPTSDPLKFGTADFSSLYNVLPGARKKMLNISVIFPDAIMKLLDQLDNNFDTLILVTTDTWFFHSAEQQILSHKKLKGKQVFIQTQEYNHKYLGNNCWRLAYSIWLPNRQIPKEVNFIPKDKGLPYGFGCLNNRPALHRLLLGVELFNRGLLDKIAYTQNNTRQDYLSNTINYLPGKVDSGYVQDLDLLMSTPGFSRYEKLLPIKWPGEEITAKNFVHHYAEFNTYCNITTESVTEMIPYEQNISLPEVSEKSPKPFISGQIPIFLAAPGHHAYFKSFGFEMMDDLYTCDFDSLMTVDRIKAIADVVALGRDYIENFYFSHLKEIKHNYDLICSDTIDKLLLKQISDLVS
jgi:hypothetical protein